MIRKILIILILSALLIGGLSYFVFDFTPNSDQKINTVKTATKISSLRTVSPISSFDGAALWYGTADGRIMRFDLSAKTESEYPIQKPLGDTLLTIIWPITGNDFIAEGNIADSKAFSYFDYSKKQFVILSNKILNLDYLNDSRRIAYVWQSDDGKLSLAKSNADNSGYSTVAQLPAWPDLTIEASPIANTVLAVRSNPEGDVSKIYSFDLDSGQYIEIVSEGKNNAAVWSSKGDKFAYTRLVDGTSMVFVYYLVSQSSYDLGLSATIDKVAFSSNGDELYVAEQSINSTFEKIVKVGLLTNEKQNIVSLDPNIHAKDLLVVGQKIFFVDATTGNLYSIE